MQKALRDAGAKAKPGEWVRANGYDTNTIKGAPSLTRADLDPLVPNNPLFIMDSSGHVAYVNSAAIKLVGLTKDTADPPQGRFIRGSDGELNGRVEEPPAFLPFGAKAPATSRDELSRRFVNLLNRAAAQGCTTLHDAGIGMKLGVGELELLDKALKGSPVRYRGMLVSTNMDDWEKLGLKPGRGDDMFRLTGIKAWADGSGQARTALQRENYLNTNSRGALNYTLDQLTDAVRRAHLAGWQVGVHANGDAAVDTVIQVYEKVLKEAPRPDHRHRIEHCSMLQPEDMTKMKQFGLSPSFLIGHIRYWGKAFRDDLLGPKRVRAYDPCASALKAGLRISIHSDYNVTPIGPLRCVQDAVTRIMMVGGEVFVPEERIPVEAALRAVTIDAAWQCHMDDIAGSLETGKYADLALLERDPTRVSQTEIEKIKVSETWLNGEQRYVG